MNVIYTNPKSTAVALKFAAEVAHDLYATIRVLAVQQVPVAIPLSRPPADFQLTEKSLLELANRCSDGTMETTIHLYRSRNALDTLGQVLEPNSLVVIGGRRRWFSDAYWIASMLRSIGHQVILVPRRSIATGAQPRLRAIPRSEGVRKHA